MHLASYSGAPNRLKTLLDRGADSSCVSSVRGPHPSLYSQLQLLLNLRSVGTLYNELRLRSHLEAMPSRATFLCNPQAGHSALDVAPSHHMQSIGPVLFAYGASHTASKRRIHFHSCCPNRFPIVLMPRKLAPSCMASLDLSGPLSPLFSLAFLLSLAAGFPLDPAQIAGNMSPYHRPSGTVSVSQTFRDCLRMALAVVATRREAIAAGSVARLVVAFRTQLRAAVGDDPHSQVRALCDRRARFLILRSAAENTSRAVGHLAALRAAAGKLGGAGPPENGGGTTHDGGAAHAEALAALHAAEAQALADAGQCQSGLPSPTTSPASAASELVDGRSCCAEALASALALLDCAECALGDASMRTVRACWDALNAGPGSRGAKLQQYAAIRCVGRRGELTMLLSDAKQGVLGARAAVDAELAAINALKKRLEDAMRGLPAGTQQAAAANAGANAGGAAAVDDSDDEVVSVSSDDEQEDGVALV